MASNNQILSSLTANLVAAASGNVTGANIANITSNLQTFISNNGTDIKSVSIQSSTDANFTGNYTLTLPVNDGNSGQVLTTDGSGVLSWANASSASGNSITNGNSNVVVNANAAVSISSNGIANAVTVNSTSSLTTVVLGVASTDVAFTNTVNSDELTLTTVSVSSDLPSGGSGNSIGLTANTSHARPSTLVNFGAGQDSTIEFWANISSDSLTGNRPISYWNYFSGFFLGGIRVLSNANIQIAFAAQGIGGSADVTLTGNTAITGGTWTHFAFVNDVTNTQSRIYQAGTLVASGAASAVNVPALSSSPTGIGGDNSIPGIIGNVFAWRSSNSVRYTANFTPSASYTSDANTVAFVEDIVGDTTYASTVDSGNLVVSGNLTANLGNINFIGAANVALGAVNNVHITGGSSGQVLTTNGSGVLSWANTSVANSITNGNSNVVVNANANVTISSAGNANIVVVTGTGVNVAGTLNATGNANTGNLGTATAIITTGNITTVNTGLVQNGNSNIAITSNANVTITANSNAVVAITSSGDGNLQTTGVNVSGYINVSGNINSANFTGVFANGNSNVSIPAANGNVTISSAGNANIVVVTGTGANITGTANVTGDILAGANVNVTSNINAATFQNGNSKVAITSNANVTITANSNAVVAITSSGDGNLQTTGGNVTGYWNVSGNSVAANFVGKLANGNSNISILANSVALISANGQANIVNVYSNGTHATTTIADDVLITGNITVEGNTNYINVETYVVQDPIIELGAGANGTAPAQNAYDLGTLLRANTASEGAVNRFMGWDTSNAEFGFSSNASDSSNIITFTSYANVRAANFIGSLANGNSNIAIAANGNITVGAIGNANIITVTGSNVITGAGVGFILTSNNGTNVRQVQLKTSTDANFSANYSLTLPVNDGNSGQILSTDGSGVLSWTAPVISQPSIKFTVPSSGNNQTFSNANIANFGNSTAYSAVYRNGILLDVTQYDISGTTLTVNVLLVTDDTVVVSATNLTGPLPSVENAAGSNTQVQFNDENAFGGVGSFTFNKTNSLLTVGNIELSGNATATNFIGKLTSGNSNITITSNANITLTAKSNATMVISDTGANITGTANISGNVSSNVIIQSFFANVSTSNTASFMATGTNTVGGTNFLDFLFVNNTGNATTGKKTFRINDQGAFEIINNAYDTGLLGLSNSGNLTIAGAYQVAGKQAVNGPAFSAWASATTTITSGSLQKVNFATEEFDTNTNFASSRFTPTVEGYYQLSSTVRLDGAVGTGECMIVIFKNGSEWKRGWDSSGVSFATNFFAMSVSALVYANGTGDYFEIYVQQGSGGSLNTNANQNISWFTGTMVRGA